MIIVPPDHAVIRESIVKHLASKKRDYIDVSYVTDFDGTVYKLSSGSPEDPDNKDMLCMSIQVVGFDEIVASMGGPEFLQDTCYAKYLRETEKGDGTRTFNVTVLANVSELTEDAYGACLPPAPPRAAAAHRLTLPPALPCRELRVRLGVHEAEPAGVPARASAGGAGGRVEGGDDRRGDQVQAGGVDLRLPRAGQGHGGVRPELPRPERHGDCARVPGGVQGGQEAAQARLLACRELRPRPAGRAALVQPREVGGDRRVSQPQ